MVTVNLTGKPYFANAAVWIADSWNSQAPSPSSSDNVATKTSKYASSTLVKFASVGCSPSISNRSAITVEMPALSRSMTKAHKPIFATNVLPADVKRACLRACDVVGLTPNIAVMSSGTSSVPLMYRAAITLLSGTVISASRLQGSQRHLPLGQQHHLSQG